MCVCVCVCVYCECASFFLCIIGVMTLSVDYQMTNTYASMYKGLMMGLGRKFGGVCVARLDRTECQREAVVGSIDIIVVSLEYSSTEYSILDVMKDPECLFYAEDSCVGISFGQERQRRLFVMAR